MRTTLTSLIIFVCLHFSCGQIGTSEQDADTVHTDSINLIHFDTLITVNAHGHVEIEFRENDTVTQHLVYILPDYDTAYYPDGCIKAVLLHGCQDRQGFEEKYFKYDHDGILRLKYTEYHHDVMGGSRGNYEMYDTTGKLIREEYHKDYMPEDAIGHLDLCGVVSTKYYDPNGRVDSITHGDYHYEGGMYCPCGDWQYFDTTGKLLRTVKYKKCGDGKTDCLEAF